MTEKPRIAIQGFEGSFHQQAAQEFFGEDLAIISCNNFPDLVRACENSELSDAGIMAIENSIAGSILPNYTLLEKSDLIIVGEIYLPIKHQLMMHPDAMIDNIREVHSHYMALLQCRDYLEKHPQWKLIEAADTALSARNIREQENHHIAAIASHKAAEIYNLKIIAEDIHTMKKNYTRFLVLRRKGEAGTIPDINKASVQFTVNNTKGSLAKILTIIAEQGINLSKLQSMPIAGTNFQYAFHVDMEFDSRDQLENTLQAINHLTDIIKLLGVYQSGYKVL